MNKQVSHIGIAALVLLAALIVATTYWQTWANAGLANRQDNEIQLVAQFRRLGRRLRRWPGNGDRDRDRELPGDEIEVMSRGQLERVALNHSNPEKKAKSVVRAILKRSHSVSH